MDVLRVYVWDRHAFRHPPRGQRSGSNSSRGPIFFPQEMVFICVWVCVCAHVRQGPISSSPSESAWNGDKKPSCLLAFFTLTPHELFPITLMHWFFFLPWVCMHSSAYFTNSHGCFPHKKQSLAVQTYSTCKPCIIDATVWKRGRHALLSY